MGYSTIGEVDLILGQALTSARPDTTDQKINLINIGDVRDLNRVPNDVVEYYISTADGQIDGIISEMYHTPIKKCVHGSWPLEADISEYNQVVELTDATNLVPGDEVIIRDDSSGDEEHHIVDQVIDQYSFLTVENIDTNFSGSDVRVIRIAFPPTINQISARFAASFVYDKYFSAQSDPNTSDYGNTMRKVATNQLNDILNGKTILREPCTRRIGDRFGNGYLDDAYAHRDRGYSTTDRNMSQI